MNRDVLRSIPRPSVINRECFSFDIEAYLVFNRDVLRSIPRPSVGD